MTMGEAATAGIGRPVARRRRWLRGQRVPIVVLALLLGFAAAWAVSMRVIATTPDPYNVGRLAVAKFRHLYPYGVPLSVRVADTNIGWMGACEGLAYLDGQHLSQSILRPDGSLYVAHAGIGHGLWIVDVEVVTGISLRSIGIGHLGPAPSPSWRYLLPFGPGRPLIGSLQ